MDPRYPRQEDAPVCDLSQRSCILELSRKKAIPRRGLTANALFPVPALNTTYAGVKRRCPPQKTTARNTP
ncbi:hypothetical protein L596_026076 [Steinernema carpocapsae]|uniref:Uncharacterized protein n=1 Tax=Steinernema carpocapsae TaxID=34508 RepID=A0A4U5M0A0_STECR|nr:hypothetical protein L596_026076 [Steinernema carpocapsae]